MVRHDETGRTIERAAVALVALIGSISGIQAAFAQDATGVTVDVADCVKLQTPEERLACYERHVDAAVKQSNAAQAGGPPAAHPAPQQASPPAAPPPPEARSASAAAPAPAAVASTSAAPASSAAPQSANKSAHDELAEELKIVATVTALKETVPNAYLITLDNGQVWRQNYPQRYPLQLGQRVTLHGTKWGGSYRLSSDEQRGFIQVERVR